MGKRMNINNILFQNFLFPLALIVFFLLYFLYKSVLN